MFSEHFLVPNSMARTLYLSSQQSCSGETGSENISNLDGKQNASQVNLIQSKKSRIEHTTSGGLEWALGP